MNEIMDPIERFKDLFSVAQNSDVELQEGAALATVGTDGRPSVRIVLLKSVNDEGFVFYTNMESRKGVELAKDPRASLCFWWRELFSQVRIEGTVSVVDAAEADEYFATRPRGSQLGAWASKQSQPLGSRAELEAKFAEVQAQYSDMDVPRPQFWSGYRLAAQQIEFWQGLPSRLHDRDLYTRGATGWELHKLYP